MRQGLSIQFFEGNNNLTLPYLLQPPTLFFKKVMFLRGMKKEVNYNLLDLLTSKKTGQSKKDENQRRKGIYHGKKEQENPEESSIPAIQSSEIEVGIHERML